MALLSYRNALGASLQKNPGNLPIALCHSCRMPIKQLLENYVDCLRDCMQQLDTCPRSDNKRVHYYYYYY